MNRSYVSFTIGFTLVFVVLVCNVNASGMNMDAFPDGLHQVPPNASPALGEVHGFLNTTLSTFSIQAGDGIYSNLLAGALTVTLNDGAPGTTGPVIGTFTLDSPGTTSGTFQGTVPLTAQQVLDMSAGITYINITDSLFPGGEIRGELQVLPEPSALVLAGLGVLALLAMRRRVSAW
ncbi:MAG TPA: CHRD domain-containing protein [Pirellulales bacterium]|jgi:hypothetical protein